VNRFLSAFLHPNLHFDSIFSLTLIQSMKLCWHQNRSRRITKKIIKKQYISSSRLLDHLYHDVAILRKSAKMCFSVVKTKKKPKFKLFNNFYKNNKIIIMNWSHAQKTTQQKTNKKKISVPDKNLENDSVTKKTVWTINWKNYKLQRWKNNNTKMVIIKIVLEVFLKTLNWFIIQCSIKLQDKSPLNPPKTFQNGHPF